MFKALLLSFLVAFGLVTHAQTPRIQLLTTLENSEVWSSIAITKTYPWAYRVLYTVALPDLYAGDLVEARVTYQLTNPYPFNVMSARFLAISDHATNATLYTHFVSRPAGRNITDNMHHDVIHDFGTFRVPSFMSGKHLVLIVYAASSASTSGQALQVNQNYGRLEVKVYPAAMIAQ